MLTDSAIAYERCAHAFLNARDQSMIGAQLVALWARSLKKDAEVIELACGAGYPITSALQHPNLKLWAIDSSPTLVDAFQRRFPYVPIACEKVQDSDFFGRSYDAVVAVGLLFLLPESEQIALINRIASILVPGGRFLFTAPIETGCWVDLNSGIMCQSLGSARYQSALNDAGFHVTARLIDEGENHYFDAQRLS